MNFSRTLLILLTSCMRYTPASLGQGLCGQPTGALNHGWESVLHVRRNEGVCVCVGVWGGGASLHTDDGCKAFLWCHDEFVFITLAGLCMCFTAVKGSTQNLENLLYCFLSGSNVKSALQGEGGTFSSLFCISRHTHTFMLILGTSEFTNSHFPILFCENADLWNIKCCNYTTDTNLTALDCAC